MRAFVIWLLILGTSLAALSFTNTKRGKKGKTFAPTSSPTPKLTLPPSLRASSMPPRGRVTGSSQLPVNGTINTTSTLCGVGQAYRKCTQMQARNGGALLYTESTVSVGLFGMRSPPVIVPLCYCPGFGGALKKFTLVLTNVSETSPLLPNHSRAKLYVNGTSPGPTLNVTQYDWVEVLVINNLQQPTAIHMHGMVQLETPYSDGVGSLSQCLIPPGQQVTYRFRASLSGTYWYHAHEVMQYPAGLFGSLIINRRVQDPTNHTLKMSEARYYGYSQDFSLMVADYYNQYPGREPLSYYMSPESEGNEPPPDAITVNGRFSVNVIRSLNLSNRSIFSMLVERQSKTRLRFTGAQALSMFRVSIDGVQLNVIETDGTTTKPTAVPSYNLSAGQRVSFLVDWSVVPTSVDAVYIRVSAITSMYSFNVSNSNDIAPWEANVTGVRMLDPDWIGIVYFQDSIPQSSNLTLPNYERGNISGTSVLNPLTAPSPPDASNFLNIVPLDEIAAPAPTHFMYTEINFFTAEAGQLSAEGRPLVEGVQYTSFNNISSTPRYSSPLLYGYYNSSLSQSNIHPFNMSSLDNPLIGPSSPRLVPIMYNSQGQYDIPYMAVVEQIIYNTDDGPHPIHKHSNPFWLVSSSEYLQAENASAANYPVRDVVVVPAFGWVKIRFIADVPGVFPQYSHIDWHLASGLFLTQITAGEELRKNPRIVPPDMQALCANS